MKEIETIKKGYETLEKTVFTCDFEYWDKDKKAMTRCGKPADCRTNSKENKSSQHVCEEHPCSLKKKYAIEESDRKVKVL